VEGRSVAALSLCRPLSIPIDAREDGRKNNGHGKHTSSINYESKSEMRNGWFQVFLNHRKQTKSSNQENGTRIESSTEKSKAG
jgi:hypothetical protein